MRFTIFAMSAALAYLAHLLHGMGAFQAVFKYATGDNPNDVLRYGIGDLPEGIAQRLYVVLIAQILLIGFRFYAQAEAIDGNAEFHKVGEPWYGKVLRVIWVLPALLLPYLLVANPVNNASDARKNIVFVVVGLFLMFVSMCAWSVMFLEQWIRTVPDGSKLTEKTRNILRVGDGVALAGVFVCASFCAFESLNVVSFALVGALTLCSIAIALQAFAFYYRTKAFWWSTSVIMVIVMMSLL